MAEEATRMNRQRFETLENSMTELSTTLAKMVRFQDRINQKINRLFAYKGKDPIRCRRTHGDDRRSQQISQEVKDISNVEDEPCFQSSQESQHEAEFPSGDSSKGIGDPTLTSEFLIPLISFTVVNDAQVKVNKAITIEESLNNMIFVLDDVQLSDALDARRTQFVIVPNNVAFIIGPTDAQPSQVTTFCYHSLSALFAKVFHKPEMLVELTIDSRSASFQFLQESNFVTVRQEIHTRNEVRKFIKDYGFLGLMGRSTLDVEQFPKFSLEDKGVFEGRGNDENCRDMRHMHVSCCARHLLSLGFILYLLSLSY